MKQKLLQLPTVVLVSILIAGSGSQLFADVVSDTGEISAGNDEPSPATEKPDSGVAPFTTPPDVDQDALTEGVQITELGCMRMLLVLSPQAADVDKLMKQRFSDVHFRVFPSAIQLEEEELSPKRMHEMGNDRYADFVVHVQTDSRLKNKLGNSALFEAETTITAYSPLSEEILAIHTSRMNGDRMADQYEAERTAREESADAAVKEVIAKLLEKAHKHLVLEAEFHDVKDNQHLARIIEYAQELEGVYHVRQMKYDKNTKVAIIEIVAAPHTENFWRAHLEEWPEANKGKKKKKPFRFKGNKQIREAYKDWFVE
ncbi:MAG: hypothetical protein CMO55_09830 [Verrucomicrobiales bacterium]|nr:hypothetical protein [Verrucomicrobiales bacterium]